MGETLFCLYNLQAAAACDVLDPDRDGHITHTNMRDAVVDIYKVRKTHFLVYVVILRYIIYKVITCFNLRGAYKVIVVYLKGLCQGFRYFRVF